MQHMCEKCGRRDPDLKYYDDLDEYWCDSCLDNAAEAAYDRHQEYLMETGGGPTLTEQMAAARKLK